MPKLALKLQRQKMKMNFLMLIVNLVVYLQSCLVPDCVTIYKSINNWRNVFEVNEILVNFFIISNHQKHYNSNF